MNKKICFAFIFFLTLLAAKAQTKVDTGHVQFIQDSRVPELMEKLARVNEKKDGKIQGYRVQIHFGSDSDKAKNIKSKFIQKYDSIPSYYVYEQPNFKIR